MISSDFEDRLREEMRHATAGISSPSGLASRARRRRRQRLTIDAAATAVTAAAAVAAAVAVTTGAVGAPQDAGIYTTAYVIKHVESALGTAAAADDIGYAHATDGHQSQWFYNGPQGMMTRLSGLSPQGRPTLQLGRSVTSAGTTVTIVNYGAKTWSRRTFPRRLAPARPPTSCGQQIPLGVDAHNLPVLTADIREALACGQLTNEGTEHVNGVNAIKLVSVQTSAPPGGPTLTYTATLWVDPVTYLPVGFETASEASNSHQPTVQGPMDITWLAPTSANLTLLTVQIPPGFTQVAPSH